MAATDSAEYELMLDEAEEEALLKSDDECDSTRLKVNLNNLAPPPLPLTDEDSLMNEAAQLAASEAQGGIVEMGISEDDINDNDDDEEEDEHMKALHKMSEPDDSDDSSLDEEDKALLEYKQVLKDIESNQFAYDKYVHLCEISHATDDLDVIRNAYQLFASVYPLAPELWLKYLNIEMNVALSTSEIEKVEVLFKKALADYYSSDIALEYANLAARLEEPERVWLEILSTYGLHCLKGQEFFKLYRQQLASQTNKSAEEKQAAYIESFLQELRYPLNNMEESYIEFKVFYEKNKAQINRELDWQQVDKLYFKAKEHLQKILPLEQQLASTDKKGYRERAEIYANYIKQCDKFLDENVLQTVYERMVADCCLNVECWLTYIDFIEYRDEFGRPEELQDLSVFQQDALDVTKRALRNCTWAEQLYIKRMRLLEKQEKTREEIQEVLESSMSAGFQTAEPAVAIWFEYLTYLRRNTDWENEGECEILRKNFNLAWTILGQQWGVLADCNCEILQFWGRIEYGPLRDVKRGKELWTTVMESADNATKSGLWIEFTQLEIRCDLDSTRKLYRKALHSPGLDNPPVIASAWERFERCCGTIKSLASCTKECTEFLLQYQQNFGVANKNSTATSGKGIKRKPTSIIGEEAMQVKKSKLQQSPPKKDTTNHANTKQTEAKDVKVSNFKEHENQEIDVAKDHLRIFLSNLDYALSEDDIRAGLADIKIVNINLIRSVNGKSRGFGYLELENEAEVEKALAKDRQTLNGRPLYVSSVLRDKEKRQKFKYADTVEPQKLFVKGLPNDVTKEELEQMFGSFGKLKDIRLIYHKSGKFKNIAYVEYDETSAASKAVMATNNLDLRGHIMSVAISAPPPRPAATAPSTSKILGIATKRNKVFDQKPRMSLIPNVVRKKLNTNNTSSVNSANGLKAAATTPATNSAKKTNEDFRKLLQRNA